MKNTWRGGGVVRPNVSYCEDNKDIHYNPIQILANFTLNDGKMVRIEGIGELTSAMTKAYASTCVSCEIGNDCTIIGQSAFSNFKNLVTLTIPNNVTRIRGYVFYNCNSLTSITSYAETAPSFSGDTFYSINRNGTLYVPSDSNYSSWMNSAAYRLGYYGWTITEI